MNEFVSSTLNPNLFFHININEVYANIDPHDTASMLGYGDCTHPVLPDDIYTIVKETMDESAECFDIRGGYQIFDDISFKINERFINVAGVEFNPRKIVFNQLKHSEQIAVFVCTAGEGISQLTKHLMATNEPLKGFISDILGSIVVETAIDLIQKKLNDDMAQKGLKITNRYSPGYCGWATHEQHKLFNLLPKDFCGIYLTESALMEPVKSVSGFIGIGNNVRFNPYTCQMCDAELCVYRKKRQKM